MIVRRARPSASSAAASSAGCWRWRRAQLGYKCHIFDPARAPVRGRCRGQLHARGALTMSAALRRLRRRSRRRHLRVRESAGRAACACSATSCSPALKSLAIAQDRGDEKALHRSHRRPRRAVALGREPGGCRAGGGRARHCRSCSRPGATAMTARARPGSARPTRPKPPGMRSAASPRLPKPASISRPNFRSSSRAGRTAAHAFWDSPDNVHRDGILRTSTVPSSAVVAAQVEEARKAAAGIAEALGHVGVLTVEFFASRRRAGRQRDRAARPQQRPLDDRGRLHLAVRAAHPRHLRPAARLDRARRVVGARWTI